MKTYTILIFVRKHGIYGWRVKLWNYCIDSKEWYYKWV